MNTIGMFRLGEAVAATPEDLRVLMDVNLGAALWLSQAVEPYMRQRGKGSIVHVSARPATDPTAGMAAYSLSKAALSHLVRILDLELRPHGIRVNAVAPQLIDTAANRALFPAERAGPRRRAGSGRERHRLPRRRPRRARQRRDRPGLRRLALNGRLSRPPSATPGSWWREMPRRQGNVRMAGGHAGTGTRMACRISELVIDCRDPERLAAFWCDVLGYVVLDRIENSVEIGPEVEGFGGLQPTLVFDVTDKPNGKLPLHFA